MSRRAFSVAVYARKGGVDGKVLVILHHRLKTWLPIGGELEENEIPLEAARRELAEETGLKGVFAKLASHHDGVPLGLLGYEEHQAGSKGMHMNFVFVCDVGDDVSVLPNEEFTEYKWVSRAELEELDSPLNVREFGFDALLSIAAA